jgi:hypothetical protein
VANLPLATRNDLKRDAIAVPTAMRSGIFRIRHATAATYERIWRKFCEQNGLDPFLSTVPDSVAWLQIFAARIRDGRLSASKNSARSGTVADAPIDPRLKPLPLPILHQAYASAQSSADETTLAAADLMWLAFFFLLRPGSTPCQPRILTPFASATFDSGCTPLPSTWLHARL